MLERKVGTKKWNFRLNCSVLGMIIVDSWLMYSGINGIHAQLTQREYYEQLATLLIRKNQHYAQEAHGSAPGDTPRVATGIHSVFSTKEGHVQVHSKSRVESSSEKRRTIARHAVGWKAKANCSVTARLTGRVSKSI